MGCGDLNSALLHYSPWLFLVQLELSEDGACRIKPVLSQHTGILKLAVSNDKRAI